MGSWQVKGMLILIRITRRKPIERGLIADKSSIELSAHVVSHHAGERLERDTEEKEA